MSLSDMVANHQAGKQDESVGLEGLKRSGGKFVINAKDWEEALGTVFTAQGLVEFLEMHMGISVPINLMEQIRVQQEAAVLVKKQRERNAKEMREQLIDLTRVKQEKREESVSDEPPRTPNRDGGSSSASSFNIRTPGAPLPKGKQAQLEEIVRRNAKRIAEKAEANRKGQGQRGIRQYLLFVNPFTCVYENERHLNPDATIPITIDDELKYYEVEDDATRVRRYRAWKLLLSTLSEIPKENYKMVESGNVYKLFITIRDHLNVSERPSLASELNKRLNSMVMLQDETLKTFIGRWENLESEMQEIDLKIDPDLLMTRAQEAVQKHHLHEYTAVITQNISLAEPSATPQTLFAALKPLFKLKEKREKEIWENEGEEKQRRKKEKKEKERIEKAAAAEMANALKAQAAAEMANALKAQVALDRVGTKPQEGSNTFLPFKLKGVCMDFQEDRCMRGSDCTFRHEKLSNADKAKLLAWLQEKGKMPLCKTCGNRHSDACRQEKGGGKTVRFAASVNASASTARNPTESTTISVLREATSSFTDEQAVLFAQQFAKRAAASAAQIPLLNLSKAGEEKIDPAKAGSSE